MNYSKGRLAARIVLAISAAALPLAGTAVPSLASASPPFTTSPSTFVPCVSIIKDGSFYYWIGQDLTSGRVAAACYQSTDLVHWTDDGDVVSVGLPPNPGDPPAPAGGLQQPGGGTYLIGTTKVMYDSVTKQYVLWVGVSIKPDPRIENFDALNPDKQEGCGFPAGRGREPSRPTSVQSQRIADRLQLAADGSLAAVRPADWRFRNLPGHHRCHDVLVSDRC